MLTPYPVIRTVLPPGGKIREKRKSQRREITSLLFSILRCSPRMEGIYLMIDKQSKSFIFTGINENFFVDIILKELVFHSNLSNKTFVFIAVLTM